jgi:transcriptional regulator with PAS, ATPase and Fis domain
MSIINWPQHKDLDEIFLQAIDGIEVVNSNGDVIYTNPAFFRISGILPEERLGKNIHDVNSKGVLATVLTTGKTFSGVKMQSPSMLHEVIGNAIPFYLGKKITGAFIIAHDITNIIQMQKTILLREIKPKKKANNVDSARYSFHDILGNNISLVKMISIARKMASTKCNILIQGETGVGKELFAHSIHNSSPRRDGPFITVNCACIPQNLLESEFFGYEKGAFTGAFQRHIGAFELANHGTIFLDEIAEIDMILQSKLLRAVELGEIVRVGGSEKMRLDIRIVAATNRNLDQMIKNGGFRQDLFFRMEEVRIFIPPLRERIEDIPILANHFIKNFSSTINKYCKDINPSAIDFLKKHNWPGNIRELKNVIHYGVVSSQGGTITTQDIIHKFSGERTAPTELKDCHLKKLAEVESEMIELALKTFDNTVEGKKMAAKALGISLGTLYNKLKNINPKQ